MNGRDLIQFMQRADGSFTCPPNSKMVAAVADLCKTGNLNDILNLVSATAGAWIRAKPEVAEDVQRKIGYEAIATLAYLADIGCERHLWETEGPAVAWRSPQAYGECMQKVASAFEILKVNPADIYLPNS